MTLVDYDTTHHCVVCFYMQEPKRCGSLTLGTHASKGYSTLSVCLSVCLLQLAWLTWQLISEVWTQTGFKPNEDV